MTKDYSNERYNPTLARCTNLSLRFDGRAVTMMGGKQARSYAADSGKPDRQGRFDYSRPRQRSGFNGPIPEGKYWINPSELWSRWRVDIFHDRRHREGWGDHRITIHPFPTTDVGKRGGFFIHGGRFRGSAGCIDLTHHMEQFVLDLRAETSLRECQMHLTVDYSSVQHQ
jgi:hypothetical protein